MTETTTIIICPNHPHTRIDRKRAAEAREALRAGQYVIFRALMGSCQCGDLDTEVAPDGTIVWHDGDSPWSYGRGRLIAMATN